MSTARRWGIADYWRVIVEEDVLAKGGSMAVSRSAIETKLAELQREYTDEAIRAGFTRFAADVATGRVDVRRKPAFFVFFARRDKYVRKVYYSAVPDHVRSRQQNPLPGYERMPENVNPLGRPKD